MNFVYPETVGQSLKSYNYIVLLAENQQPEMSEASSSDSAHAHGTGISATNWGLLQYFH